MAVSLKDFQPIADSPTEKYYTDWKTFAERLDIPPATSLDPISLKAGGEWCLLDPTSIESSACHAGKSELERRSLPQLGEYMLEYHATRAPSILSVTINTPTVVLLRGGNGYVGYNLKVTTRPLTRTTLVIVDSALHDGLKTQYLRVEPGEDSQIDIYHMVIHKGSPVYSILEARMPRGARVTYRLAGTPGIMTRHRLIARAEGEESRLDVTAGIIAKEAYRGDFILGVDHTGPRSASIVSARGVALDRSRLVLRGTARVQEEAHQSATRVEMHVYVLGEEAKGRSVPMLEIYTGDVQEASHSAAVTMLGEEARFYAATRGLSSRDLVGLIAYGIIERTGMVELLEQLEIFNLLYDIII